MPPKDKEDRANKPWTLTDAMAEAFALGFETAGNNDFKEADDALDDDAVCERLDRIQTKFANEFLGVAEHFMDVAEEEEEVED